MKILLDSHLSLTQSDCIAVPLTQNSVKNLKKLFAIGARRDKKFSQLLRIAEDYIKNNNFEGEKDEVIFAPASAQNRLPRILIYGMGEDKKLTIEATREFCSKIAKLLNKQKVENAQITGLSWRDVKNAGDILKAMAEGILLGDYAFDHHKNKKDKKYLKKLTLIVSEVDPQKYKDVIRETEIICENVNYVRTLINEGGEEKTPETLEREVRKLAREHKLELEILNKSKLEKLGCNLILTVGNASRYAPRMFIIGYNGDKKSKETVAVVGKGVTFDTGGLDLKPSNYMEDMQLDMGGGGVVIGLLKTAAELKLKRNIIGVVPCVENAIGSRAYKPGAIIKAYNDKTVEVINTDAEGRLVLGDALAYTVKNYKPSLLIDIATLTGATIYTFGRYLTAMFSNDEKIAKKIFDAGEKTYERVWRMPLYEEYRDEIKSLSADVKNLNEKYGGIMVGAAFLEHFIDDSKWLHLDIAGSVWTDNATPYYSKGATGVGLRLLMEFLKIP